MEQKKSSKAPLIIGIIFAVLAIGVATVVAIAVSSNSGDDKVAEQKDDKRGDNKTDDVKNNDDKTDKKDDGTKKDNKSNTIDSSKIIKASEDNGNIGDHVRGNENAKVIVIEYADLQCPGCASMMPKVNSLYKKYGSEVAFIYRNFPITGHQNARPAAIAAEAAARQGKYWEMVEYLYANRAEWISEKDKDLTEAFVSAFKKVAPNGKEDVFRKDMHRNSFEKKIDFDYNLGRDVDKINATPTFIINGEAIDVSSVQTVADYAEKLEDAIKKAIEETK